MLFIEAAWASGLVELREMIQGYLTAFPDLEMTVERQVVEGDLITNRWTVTGTHDGPLEDMEPTGKTINISGLIISRFEGGKIAGDTRPAVVSP